MFDQLLQVHRTFASSREEILEAINNIPNDDEKDYVMAIIIDLLDDTFESESLLRDKFFKDYKETTNASEST